MKSKTITIFIVIVVAVISTALFIRYQNIALLEEGFKSTGISTSTAQVKWNTYVNTKYGYILLYPKGALLGPAQEEERLPAEESSSIDIGMPGGVPPIGIQITAWAPYTYKTTDKMAIEYNRVASLDLKSFATALRQKFVDDKNSNFPNKNIGELEEINFAGQKAYVATVTGYMDGYGSDTFRYIYINNGTNNLALQYSLKGDLSKQIIDTVALTHSNMAGIPAQDTWLTYENTVHHYRINYPPNSGGVQVFPYPDEYTRIRPSIGDTIQISTPRGALGISALTSKSTAVHSYWPMEQQDAVSKIKYLLSLNIKSFAEELCNEQAHRASKIGSDPNGYPSRGFGMCRTDDIQEGIVSGQKSYTFDITGRLDTLFTTVLVPGMIQEYKYTFFENENGEKFLVWYPANEPVFNEIVSSFKFVN